MTYDEALAIALPLARKTQGRVWIVETRYDGWQVQERVPLLRFGKVFAVSDSGQVTYA